MKKYKVSFSGFAYVEADSPEEAEELFHEEETAVVYSEYQADSVEEVDDFVVNWTPDRTHRQEPKESEYGKTI